MPKKASGFYHGRGNRTRPCSLSTEGCTKKTGQGKSCQFATIQINSSPKQFNPQNHEENTYRTDGNQPTCDSSLLRKTS